MALTTHPETTDCENYASPGTHAPKLVKSYLSFLKRL